MIGFALSELFLTSNGRSHLEFKEQLSECSVCINFRHCPINPGLLKYFVAGNVPGPIVFGVIFDTACLVWQYRCDERGSCWIYDSLFVAEGIFWACVVVKSISSLGFLLALLVYRPPPDETIDEIDVTDSKDDVIQKKEPLPNGVDNIKSEGVENSVYDEMTEL